MLVDLGHYKWVGYYNQWDITSQCMSIVLLALNLYL